MVPAEDFDEYDAEDYGDYADHQADHGRAGRGYSHRPSYLDHNAYDKTHDNDYEPYPAPARRRLFAGGRPEYRDDVDTQPDHREVAYPPAGRPRSRPAWASEAPPVPVHGALAVETRREPVSRMHAEPVTPSPSSYPLGRIVTLHPTSYNEARVRR
jgi:cell division inhibitor SepF